MRVRGLVLLVCLTACGRIGFDARGDGGDDDGHGDAKGASTGPKGPRWIAKYDNVVNTKLAGANGEVAAVASFVNTFAGDGINLTGVGLVSTAVLRYDAAGTLVDSYALEADSSCDLRDVVVDGSDIVLGGFAKTNTALPQYGLCGVVTSRQTPLIFRIDKMRQQTLVAQWTSSGNNAQGWDLVRLPDDTFVMGGIYSQDLTIGSNVLPTATADPSLFLARTKPGATTDATWSRGIAQPSIIYAGPMSADGDEICLLGAHMGNVTVFGTALPYVGSADAFVARIDSSGNPKFVRAIGSPANESYSDDGAIIALPDGGCAVGITAAGDVTLDGTNYAVTQGMGMGIRFSATGAVVNARRFPNDIYVTNVGNRIIALERVDSNITIGTTPYVAEASDVLLVELGATAQDDILLAAVHGAGTQDNFKLATVAPDAVAFIVTTNGQLTFGSTSFDTGATQVRAIGVLGI